MKALALLLLAGLAAAPARAQLAGPPLVPATGRRVADFIPKGYGRLANGYVTGDLNHDGRPDVALVLRPLAEDTTEYLADSLPPRQLLLLFRIPTGYVRAAQSARLILCKHCGGVWGDPLEGLAIAKGVLTVFHYGGSGARWNVTSRFRYQAGAFYLIGESRVSYHSSRFCGNAGWQFHDTNFVTGEYREEVDSERCRPLVRRRGRRPPAPLRRLADYAPEP